MPSKGIATPHNIAKKIRAFTNQPLEIDLFVIDIDSFDYEIMQSVLENNIHPRVVVVEYNPSLPPNIPIFWPYELERKKDTNPRLYGASFKAWDILMSKQKYSLVHISGFCNLFYIRDDIEHCFKRPCVKTEITDTKEKVLAFAVIIAYQISDRHGVIAKILARMIWIR